MAKVSRNLPPLPQSIDITDSHPLNDGKPTIPRYTYLCKPLGHLECKYCRPREAEGLDPPEDESLGFFLVLPQEDDNQGHHRPVHRLGTIEESGIPPLDSRTTLAIERTNAKAAAAAAAQEMPRARRKTCLKAKPFTTPVATITPRCNSAGSPAASPTLPTVVATTHRGVSLVPFLEASTRKKKKEKDGRQARQRTTNRRGYSPPSLPSSPRLREKHSKSTTIDRTFNLETDPDPAPCLHAAAPHSAPSPSPSPSPLLAPASLVYSSGGGDTSCNPPPPSLGH